MTRSRGKTQVTPMIPAIPPLMILGRMEKVWPPVGAAGVGTDVTACGKKTRIRNGFLTKIKAMAHLAFPYFEPALWL